MFFPYLSSGIVTNFSTVAVAGASALLDKTEYRAVVITSACWLRQGTAKLVTCATKANLVDTDFITITTPAGSKTYEFDTAGNGVTAGRVQVNVSTDTTAATVAARLRTAILANQTELRVVDPTDGTLQIDLPESRDLTVTESVAHVSFTIGAGIMQASAATGSTYFAAGAEVSLDGRRGAQVGVIRDAVDGKLVINGGERV